MRNSSRDTRVTDATIVEVRKILLAWEKEHYQNYPWRTPDQLWYGLVAEILLQRTKARNVIAVYETFIRRFPTLESLSSATENDVEAIIYPLGLRWRAPLLRRLGEQLVQLDGEIPRSLDGLLELSGVGTYVASAWLSFHGGGRSVIIDANVVRWMCRLVGRLMDGETRRKKWLIELADRFTPDYESKAYNYAVLDFSMEICTPLPKCEQCPIGPDFCHYRHEQILHFQ